MRLMVIVFMMDVGRKESDRSVRPFVWTDFGLRLPLSPWQAVILPPSGEADASAAQGAYHAGLDVSALDPYWVLVGRVCAA
jgi:hypothetical protein